MKFKFKCNQCGFCCQHYKIIITLYDALKIFHNTNKRFVETFYLYKQGEVQANDNLKWFDIDNKKVAIGIISDKNGCIFLKDNLCSIDKFKPGLCYFYPISYDEKFIVKKYEICKGDYDKEETEFEDIESKYLDYYMNEQWHNEMVDFWNKYYKNQTEKDFIIFFYESLYPLFLKKIKKK